MGRKSKQTNQKFLKTKNKQRYNRYTPRNKNKRNSTEKRKKNELIFVSLDSNIIIDMCFMLQGRIQSSKMRDINYYKQLGRLLKGSAISPDGSINPSGKYVFCVVPSVFEELSDKDGVLHASVKNFVENKTVVLKLDPSRKPVFDRMVDKMIKGYAEHGYFLDDNGKIKRDANIVAESSFFNLTLLSRDHHIIIDPHDPNPERKILHFKGINRRFLQSDFCGFQAEPFKVTHFLTEASKGKKMPYPENIECLDCDTQKTFKKDFGWKGATITPLNL